MMSKRRNKRETAQRFSLRKSAFGATSVLLGSVFLMEAGLTTVQADMMIQTTEQDCDCELTSSQTPEEVQKQAEDKVVQWQQADGELSKITQDIVRTDNVILELEEQIESGLNTHTPQLDENLQKQLSVQNQISTVQEQMKTVEDNLSAARKDLSTAELEEEKVRLKVEGAQSEREEIEEKRLNTAIKLGELEKYRADVETWIEGADEQPKLQNWEKFFSDFKEEAEIDKLAKNYVEHYRVVYNTLVAELEDSQKYYEETKQYAIVRHVSNIYEKSYPVARRRAHARSENGWLPKDGVVPASVIYSGTDVVEKLQFDTNYVPSMKNVSQFALEYIKTLRDINGVSANNIEVTERALEYAMKRALEVGELLPGAGGRHNTILKSPGGEPSPVENLANPSNILKYNEELFIHSDKELAYYLILDWFAEYNMRDTDFGHTKNLFNVENAEFGMWNSAGPKSHNYTYELINPENGQYTQSTLLRSGTGVALPSTFSISSRTELDTESGLSRDVKRIQLNRTSEDEYRYTLVKRSGQELFVYARENLTTPGDDRITSAYDVDYADFNHSQLGSGKKFEYSKKVLHPETGTYFRTDSGKWYLLTGDDYQELTDVSEEIKSDSSTRVTPTDAVFLPRTSFIYSVPDEKTYNQELKRIEEKVKTTRNILYTLLEHKESPIKSELVRLQDELQKLDEQLKSTDSAELDLAKEETKKAKDRVNSLETAQVNLQDELQKLEAELLKLKAEEKLIRDELAKVQDKQMEKERLQKDLDSYNRNKSNLENRKKELEKEISLLCAISEEEIPFGKSYQDDASLYEGTEKDITSGQVGIKQIVTSYSLVAGKLRTQETVTTTKETVNAVIARGTKPTPTPVTVTEYRQIDNGVQEYQLTKLDGKVTEEKPGQIYQNTLETKTVAYTTIKEDDATLTAGTTKVKQAGANGSREVGVTYTVENGQLKKIPFDRLVKAAVDEIVLVGTRQPVRKTETSYRAIANGVEEYATDYVDEVQSGQPRLVKTHTNAQAEVISFEKVQEEDATLPVGETKVKQAGVNGSRLVGKLYSVENGQLKVTEVNEVTAAIPEITLIGTRQPVRKTETSYRAIANGVEEYATDYVDDVQSGQPRLVKTYTNAQAEVISFEKVQEEDATLPVGETKVKQAGVNGSRLVGKLYSVENGQLKVTEVNEVTAAIPEITLIGTRQPVRRTDTTYKAIANGVEEYATDYVDGVQSGQPRLVKTYTNAQAEVISFEKVQEEDTSLPVGETKVKQVGVNGSRRVGKLYSVENGQLKVTEVNEVTAAIPEITLVGTRQPVRKTEISYRAIANGVEEYATDYVDGVQSGQSRLVKTYTNVQAEVIPFEKVQEEDASLPVGETKVKQAGVNGSRLVGNLYSVEDGQLRVTEVNEVTAAIPEITLVGTRQPESEQVEEVPAEPSQESETPVAEQPTQPEQVEEVPTSSSSEPETPVVEQPTQSETEQAEVVPVEPETETPAVEQPTQLEPEQVDVVPTEPVEQPEPATQPDEELVTAVPDTAPQEDEKPEYIFNPDDFKDVLEPEVEEKADAPTVFSRFAGTWVNSIGQSFTISETGAFSGHFNENQVAIYSVSEQGVVVFSNGGPSVVLPSYLPAGYTDSMTTNSDSRLERFVFMGDAWADNRGALLDTAFFYRLGEKPVLAATEETIPTVANGGGFAGAGSLTEPVVDAVAFPAATSQEPATVVAESALPNTGDAVSLISLLGASMVATAGVGIKRRRR